MNTNKENTTMISIISDYDKICILEKIIKYQVKNDSVRIVELIISNFIDSITKEENNTEMYLNLLKQNISESKLLNLVIELSISIAKNIPILLGFEVNQQNRKQINFIKHNNNHFILPLF